MIIPAIQVERAYLLPTDGSTSLMDAVLAKEEDKELQTLLRNNFDLLPGDQIDPESPCRWMLVKREMPVPDPYSEGDRWSIDFFFVDQNATSTFVECKRYVDTRSRKRSDRADSGGCGERHGRQAVVTMDQITFGLNPFGQLGPPC